MRARGGSTGKDSGSCCVPEVFAQRQTGRCFGVKCHDATYITDCFESDGKKERLPSDPCCKKRDLIYVQTSSTPSDQAAHPLSSQTVFQGPGLMLQVCSQRSAGGAVGVRCLAPSPFPHTPPVVQYKHTLHSTYTTADHAAGGRLFHHVQLQRFQQAAVSSCNVADRVRVLLIRYNMTC